MRSAKCGMPKGKGRGRAGQDRAGQGPNWGIKQRRKANLWLLSRKYVAFVAILPPSARFKLCESAENMQSNRNFMLRLAALSLFFSPSLALHWLCFFFFALLCVSAVCFSFGNANDLASCCYQHRWIKLNEKYIMLLNWKHPPCCPTHPLLFTAACTLRRVTSMSIAIALTIAIAMLPKQST